MAQVGRHFYHQRKQRGTALITVILIAAVIIVMVVESVKTVRFQKHLSSNLINRDQAYAYLMGMEELAKIWLKRAFEETKEETVHLNQLWAQDDITFPLEGGAMTANIVDMQSCFNLNTIAEPKSNNSNPNTGSRGGSGGNNPVGNRNNPGANPNPVSAVGDETPGQKVLEELINQFAGDSDVIGKDLAVAARDWLDEDFIEAGAAGAEDSYYQGMTLPYRTGNGPIAHPSELLTMKGFDRKVYQAIRPYVCVLPDTGVAQINVNTVQSDAAALIFAVIGGKGTTQGDISQALSERPEEGYESVQAFVDKLGQKAGGAQLDTQFLTVTSRFFEVQAKAEIGKTRVEMKTLFHKDDENNFKVVSRYFGRE